VIHKRAATGMMKDFCEAGFEACALASGENEDSGVVIGHGQSIVHWTGSFDNAAMTRSSEVEGSKSSIGGGEYGSAAAGGDGVLVGGDFPGRGIGQEATDKLGMEGVAGFASFDAAEEWKADEGEVADEVEGFVAAELIRIAERAVHDAVPGKNDGVIEGAAADETHGAEGLDIGFEAKGAGAGENLAERVGIYKQFDLLLADLWMGKIDVAADAEFVGGMDGNATAVFDDFDGLEDAEIASLAAKAAEAGSIEKLEKGLCGTIENGDFDVVDVDEDVVDAVGIGGSEKVLGGGKEDALLHKAGGVADASDVVAVGFDGEVVKVNATENDAGVWRSRLKTELGMDSCVETHTLGFYRTMNCRLKHRVTH